MHYDKTSHTKQVNDIKSSELLIKFHKSKSRGTFKYINYKQTLVTTITLLLFYSFNE